MYKDYFTKWNTTDSFCNLASICISEIITKFVNIIDTNLIIHTTLIQVKYVTLESVLWSFYI